MQLGIRKPLVRDLAAFPAARVLDDFNRPDGLVGANWLTNTYFGPVSVISNQAGRAAGSCDGTWVAANFSAFAQEVYLTLPAGSGATSLSLFVRLTNGGTSITQSGYSARFSVGNTLCTVSKLDVGDVTTGLGILTASSALAVGDSLGVRCVGDAITIYRKPSAGAWGFYSSGGQAASTITNSIYRGGRIGFRLENAAQRVDNFGGGNVST